MPVDDADIVHGAANAATTAETAEAKRLAFESRRAARRAREQALGEVVDANCRSVAPSTPPPH